MNKVISRRYRKSKKLKNGQASLIDLNPTREELERAVEEYLSNGGKITRIEPLWIEEGKVYIFE